MAFPASSKGRIHILGIGNLGRLYAHALATQPNPPPITLLFHRTSLLQEWGKAGRAIGIVIDGEVSKSDSYDVEVVEAGGQDKAGIIENLIIATKSIHTSQALSAIKHRLSPSSNILFSQNGMGTTDEVSAKHFPSPSSRPNYLAAVTSHGVYSQGPFRSVLAGKASIFLSNLLPQPPAQPRPHSHSEYLLGQITRPPLLNATAVSPRQLISLQFEKLVINAIINPLTAIFNCRNGELTTRAPIVNIMRALIVEASMVLVSLPELRSSHPGEEGGEEDTESRFSPQSLELRVLDMAEKTAQNTSSMLQDVRAGRKTEIDYINGYIVRRGREMGVDVRTHEKLAGLVREGRTIGADEALDIFDMRSSWLAGLFSPLGWIAPV